MRSGEVIADRYELVRAARAGASGTVFEAFDRKGSRRAAVKVITPPRDDPGFVARIEREIKILSALSHPNIVAYHGSGQLPDGKVYLVLEWLSGMDLADFKQQASLSLREALEICRQVAGALTAVHEREVIHRDIKPANIFLIGPRPGATPDVRVLDFGVAKAGESAAVTRAGAILGTPAYMAPEQASLATSVDGRADVFSLGVVLYELIAGRLPWQSRSDLARLARILTEVAAPLCQHVPAAPVPVSELIDRMLALKAADRPESMSAVLKAIEELLARTDPAALDKVYVERAGDLARFVQEETAEARMPSSHPPPVRVEGEGGPKEPSAERSRDVDAPLTSAASLKVSAFLGRKSVLDKLLADVGRSLSESRATSLAVLGPAGIGKTRLRLELSRSLRSEAKRPRVFAARGEEQLRSTPYGFLRRVLLSEARIFPDDPLSVQRRKLDALIPSAVDLNRPRKNKTGSLREAAVSEERTRFTRLDSWSERPSLVATLNELEDEGRELSSREEIEEDRESVLAFVGEALEIAPADPERIQTARRDPRLMAAETRRSFDLFLRALSFSRGLVILVDDAHLLDRQSAQVLRELVRRGRTEPLAVVAFALPNLLDEPKDGRAPWTSGAALVLDLPPLDASASRSLARLVAESPIRSDVLELIIQRGAGNPLYLEQLVRSLCETGVLAGAKGAELTLTGLKGQSADLDLVPTTVAAAVRARYDALDEDARDVLAAAAVSGEVFWAEGVARVLDHDLEEVMLLLDRLTSWDFVRRRSQSRYHRTSELEFSHGVIRSVVLSRMKRGRRRELERGVVAFFESVGERDAATLAAHRVQAGWRRDAAALYAVAAERSVASGDFAAASALAGEGLLLIEGGEVPAETHAALLDVAARAFELCGELEEADHALELLATLAVDPAAEARVGVRRARIARSLERFDEARRLAGESGERLGGSGDRVGEACARVVEAEAAEAAEDDRAALRLYVAAQGPLEASPHRQDLARVTAGLARIALASGDYRTADGRYRASLVHARAAHEVDLLIEALVGLGLVSRRIGQTTPALRYFEAAERLILDPRHAGQLWARRALLSAELGDVGAAEQALEVLIEEAKAHRSTAAWILAWLSWAQLMVGYGRGEPLDRERARAAAGEIEAVISEARLRTPWLLLPLEIAQSHLLSRAGEAGKAFAIGGTALARFEQRGVVREDEAPRLFLVHALTLRAAAAPEESLAEARRKAVEHLDLISSRLDRTMRERYLARPLAKEVIEEAGKGGLKVDRDPRSQRLTIR